MSKEALISKGSETAAPIEICHSDVLSPSLAAPKPDAGGPAAPKSDAGGPAAPKSDAGGSFAWRAEVRRRRVIRLPRRSRTQAGHFLVLFATGACLCLLTLNV